MAAKKSGGAVENGEPEKVGSAAMAAPDGFQKISQAQAHWVKPVPGMEIRGVLLGRYKRKKPDASGKQGHFYQIKLTKGAYTSTVKEDGEEVEKTTSAPDGVVTIDERSALEVLRGYAEDPNREYEVVIQFPEKISIGGGKSFWRTECFAKTKGKKLAPSLTPHDNAADADDIPF